MMGLNLSVLALVWANEVFPTWIKIILTILLGFDGLLYFLNDDPEADKRETVRHEPHEYYNFDCVEFDEKSDALDSKRRRK